MSYSFLDSSNIWRLVVLVEDSRKLVAPFWKVDPRLLKGWSHNTTKANRDANANNKL